MLITPRAELNFHGPVLVNGLPLLCPECDAAYGHTVTTGSLPFENLPAWVNCPDGHGWEEDTIPNGLLAAAVAERTYRQKAGDIATTSAAWNRRTIEGELAPEMVADDLRVAARTLWNRAIKPEAKRRFRHGRRAVTSALAETAKDVVATPKAAALRAAWELQSGQAIDADNPQARTGRKRRRCPSCKGRGYHDLKTRIHTEDRVPCSLCSGTGDRDQLLEM
jgi:hypothetical protein